MLLKAISVVSKNTIVTIVGWLSTTGMPTSNGTFTWSMVRKLATLNDHYAHSEGAKRPKNPKTRCFAALSMTITLTLYIEIIFEMASSCVIFSDGSGSFCISLYKSRDVTLCEVEGSGMFLIWFDGVYPVASGTHHNSSGKMKPPLLEVVRLHLCSKIPFF